MKIEKQDVLRANSLTALSFEHALNPVPLGNFFLQEEINKAVFAMIEKSGRKFKISSLPIYDGTPIPEGKVVRVENITENLFTTEGIMKFTEELATKAYKSIVKGAKEDEELILYNITIQIKQVGLVNNVLIISRFIYI